MILVVCPNPSIDSFAWIDKINAGEVNRIKKIKEYPGGKGVHVALALNEIGISSELIGFWGGRTGSWIKNACYEEGIISHGPNLLEENRKCYTFKSDDPDWKETELLGPGPNVSFDDYNLILEQIESHSLKTEIVCLSGSWPLNSPDHASKEVVINSNNANKKVILDTSGVQLQNALEGLPFGLHINIDEAKALCGSDEIDVIMNYLSKYVELIAITVGKDGAYIKYGDEIVHAVVSIENEYSCVGSGDCFTAGIAFGIYKGMSLENIAKWAVACGAANCIRKDLGMLYKSDVEDLIKRVIVENLM